MSFLNALAIEQKLWIKSAGEFFTVPIRQERYNRIFGNFGYAGDHAACFVQTKRFKHFGWHFDVGVDDR